MWYITHRKMSHLLSYCVMTPNHWMSTYSLEQPQNPLKYKGIYREENIGGWGINNTMSILKKSCESTLFYVYVKYTNTHLPLPSNEGTNSQRDISCHQMELPEWGMDHV